MCDGIDGETGENLWSTDLNFYQISFQSELNLCSGWIGSAVHHGKRLPADGLCHRRVLGRCETTAPILDVTIQEGQ